MRNEEDFNKDTSTVEPLLKKEPADATKSDCEQIESNDTEDKPKNAPEGPELSTAITLHKLDFGKSAIVQKPAAPLLRPTPKE